MNKIKILVKLLVIIDVILIGYILFTFSPINKTNINDTSSLDNKLILSLTEKGLLHDYSKSNESKNIILSLTTEKMYSCLGYKINTNVTRKNNTIKMDINGITSSGQQACSAALGPAEFTYDLGDTKGTYTLLIQNQNKKDTYQLVITEKEITIQNISSSFTYAKESKFIRFPIGTIMVGCWKNQEILCSRFFSDLQSIEGRKANDQSYAQQIVKMFAADISPSQIPNDFIMYRYSGSFSTLDNLLTRYATTDLNSKIEIYTWDGHVLSTWTKKRNIFPEGEIMVECIKKQGDVCSQFFDDLEHLGAKIHDNQEPLVNQVMFTYTGDIPKLDSLLSKYAESYPDSIVDIKITTWDGQELDTWSKRPIPTESTGGCLGACPTTTGNL